MRVYFTVKTSTHYLTRLIVNIKKKSIKQIVSVVFFLWCFVIQLTKRTKSKPFSCLLLKTFEAIFSSPGCVIQNNVRRLISSCNERRFTLFIVLWSSIIGQYTDAYLKFIMSPLLYSWAINRLLLLRGTLPCKPQTPLQMLIEGR